MSAPINADILNRAQLAIAEAQGRADAATPGPWSASWAEWECNGPNDCPCQEADGAEWWKQCIKPRLNVGAWVNGPATEDTGEYDGLSHDADVDLMAHARADVPALAEAAAALVGLMTPRDPDEPIWPWWARGWPDQCMCIGCRGGVFLMHDPDADRDGPSQVAHESDCAAMVADAAVRRLAGDAQ